MENSLSETQIEPAVKEQRWEEVNSFLSDSNYSSSVVEQFITACEEYGVIWVDGKILSYCTTEQRNRLLKTAVKKERRWEVISLLRSSNYSSSVVEQFITAYVQYGVFNVDHEILSHCTIEQRNRLLKTAVKKERWWGVISLLRSSNYSSSVVEQFITACEEYGVIYADHEILSYCTIEQRNRLLKTAVKKERWLEVTSLLRSSNYSSSVVEQFITAYEQYGVIYVDHETLSHCTTEQRNRLLETAVKKERWGEVKSLLSYSNYSSSVVEQFFAACEQYGVIYVDHEILSHPNCHTEQRNRLLKTAVKKERWGEVQSLLSYKHYSSSVVELFFAACKEYGVIYVDQEILSHCNTEQRNRLLKTAVKKERWGEVKSLLSYSNYSSSGVEQFFTACEQYGVIYVNQEILYHCSTEQRNRLLKIVVKEEKWEVVNLLLGDSNYNSSVVEQFITACEQYDVINVDGKLLTHCNTEQRNRLLKTAVKEERGEVVKSLLRDTNYSSSVVDQFITAFEEYGVVCVDDETLLHCNTEQRNRLLKTSVKKERWREVKSLLSYSSNSSSVVEQFITACEQYGVIFVDQEILYHCNTEQRNRLLKTAVKKERWREVNSLLSDSNYSSSVVEQFITACEQYDVIYVDGEILISCNITQQLDRFLALATMQCRWNVVEAVLKAGVCHEKRVWVIEQAYETADDREFMLCILPYCSDDQLESVLTHLVIRGLWGSVVKVLKRGVSDTQRRWAVGEASKTANDGYFEYFILPHCNDDQLESVLTHLGARGMWGSVREVFRRGVSDNSRILALSELCKGLTVKYTYTTVMSRMGEYLKTLNLDVQFLIKHMPSNQLSREAQSVALRFALQQGKWDVISRASLSQVWEQVRRHLFREAVYQKRWTIVRKWADHTLYDDERWWALEEAYKHKQWDVMLQLADHGLTEIELMRVRYRMAKHADWDVVLRMIGRGVDVTEVRQVVENIMISRKTKTTTDRATQEAFKLRWWQLCQLEKKLTRDSTTCLKLPSTARQWDTVLFHLHRHPRTASVPSRSQPSKTFGGLLLQRAIEQGAWHVVMHLVRLGIGTDQLESMLTDMMRRRQWGVCRALLEQGVSVQSCLSALSVFMEKNQWTLVSRVMEFIVDDALKRQVEQLALDRNVGSLVWQCVSSMFRYGIRVGDAVRLKVMQRAMERREGSVVGECISTLQHCRLSVKEREELFQQAISRGVLQAVKPLVEEKNKSETQDRDAAILAAIEHRQWDVVDCCQLQGVDIDIKDVYGETPLNREVRKQDMNTVEWKAVEELLVRGADPNVLDKDGRSVLNRAIKANQWDIVRLLIECLGDIHMEASDGTPLPLLIDKRQGEIIHHTLIWCPDQAKGVNKEEETTLHAIALDKKPELMYYQIVRGVNPLTVTKLGHSVLFYAMQNEHCPQRMVGECIRLGFSTHQPPLTKQTTTNMVRSVTNGVLNDCKMFGHYTWYYGITSPFLVALLRGMPVVAHMLYESGSSSYSELLHLYTELQDLSDPHTEVGRKLREGEYLADWHRSFRFAQYRQRYDTFINKLTTFLPYLREMASTPRSLVSTCRLVISHCLTVRRRHERAVQDLDLTDRMKDFLLFSDLTDTDYQWFLYGTLPPLKVKKKKQNSKALRRQRQRGARRT